MVLPKNFEAMLKFAETYAQRTDTFFCSDTMVTATVIEGLAKHKSNLGSPLCPCRHYDDKQVESNSIYWNCPCIPMRERKECHCMLFLTSDNDFCSKKQNLEKEDLLSYINK
jgi:ferredoxin-thioredoxin reductase catalytic chain|uniref:ferredoxin thioreductase subunit beta n=1 Tax=Fibrocapsa japonica TaxID=94617 RepID=UPI002115B4B8|nr:ferredoxin thioreductase subunit beta [Fibrocapsa japonica]UTE95217.1 ferredoxin thioreductase subunit beta [Fibrocapsa japonica]